MQTHRMPLLLVIFWLALLSSTGSVRAADEGWTSYLPPGDVKALLDVDGSLWIGTGHGGIRLLDKASGTMRGLTKGPETYHSNRITSLATDQSGAVWVGNAMGVSRFRDGKWTVFDAKNSPLPEAPHAVLAYNPRRGCICIGTQQGLIEYDGQEFTLITEAEGKLPFNNINFVEVDRAGRTWIARAYSEQGRPRFARQNVDGSWQAIHVPDLPNGTHDAVTAFEAGPNGRLWYSIYSRGVYSFKEGESESERLRNHSVAMIASGSDGSIFINTQTEILWLVDGEWETSVVLELDDPSALISSFILDEDRPAWIGARSQVFKVGEADVESYPVGSPAVDFSHIFKITSTVNGDVWAACGSGLYRLRAETWEKYISDYPLLPGGVDFRGAAPAGDSSIWTIGQTAGLFRFDGRQWEVFDKFNIGKDLRLSHDITVDHSGSVWIATGQSGFNRFDGEQLHSISRLDGSGFEGARISSLAVASDGSVWTADSFDGLGVYSDGVWRWMTAGNSDLPSNELRKVYAGLDGEVWLVFRDQPGIYRYDGHEFQALTASNSGFAGEYATAFAAAPDGTIWIGSAVGLYRLRKGQWSHINVQNSGLPDNFVRELHIDQAGNLWIGTQHGQIACLHESLNVSVAGPNTATAPADAALRLYPNPAHHRLAIELHKLKAELRGLRLYDAAGRTILLPEADDASALQHIRRELDISHLRAGRYFLIAETGTGSYSASFIVR